jgi:hypothetical protein
MKEEWKNNSGEPYTAIDEINKYWKNWEEVNVQDDNYIWIPIHDRLRMGNSSMVFFAWPLYEQWWNPDKFNWVGYSRQLGIHVCDDFEIWWNPEKFNWVWAHILKMHCHRFEHIWAADYIIHTV